METLYTARARSERLIAAGRAALATFALLAIWLDPSEPAKHQQETYGLLAGYVAYSLLLLGLAWWDLLSNRLAVVTHLVDISAFTLILYLTEGPTSPFFVYFVFALFAAALRWRWRGVLWTALATLAIFIALGLYADFVLRDPAFELNRFIIRSVYLAVIAILLAYLSAYEQRLRGELAKLAAWPRHVPESSLVERALRQAAAILDVPRAVMVWEEAEEPWRHRATLTGSTFETVREPAPAVRPLVAGPLADADFLCLDAAHDRPTVLRSSGGGLHRWRGVALDADLRAQLAIESVLSVRMDGEDFEGRLFFLDKPGMTADDLILGEIVAHQVSADLSQLYAQQRLRRAAISEERVSFARELHDGVLQLLTGLALQLEGVRRLTRSDPEAAETRLGDMRDLLAAEQADLRFFVRQMRPLPVGPTEVNSSLLAHLEELGERAKGQWGLRVELSVGLLTRQLPETLAHGVYRILQEALANAARHGHATVVCVDIGTTEDRLHITVADDGRGFSFRGRHDLAALARMKQGPVSLKERIESLQGDLAIESSEAGACLEISLPLGPDLRLVSASDIRRAPSVDSEKTMERSNQRADRPRARR